MAAAQQRLGTSRSEGQLSNSKLSDSRRQKLISLKKREDLKDALTEKFKNRFGHQARERGADEASVASSCIRREVDSFAERADVTEANLGRLERRLQCRAQMKAQGRQDDQVSCAGVSAYSNMSRRSRSVASMAGESVLRGQQGQAPEAFDWSRLDEYAGYLHEQDSIRQKMGVAALQRKMKMDLDHQVAEKKSKKADQEEEDLRYHHNSMVELDRWRQMEQMRNAEMKAKLMREKADRDEQLAFERKIKAEESQRKKDEESALVDKIVTEMENEQRRYEKKKAQRKASMRAVFEENLLDQQKRNQAAAEMKEKEAFAMAEYNRILDEQEEQRANELQARLDRQKELMDKLQSNVAEQAKCAGDNDAQRAAAQQEEIDRHYFQAERKKQDRLKQLRLENQAYLFKQMEEKESRKAEDAELTHIQAQILRRDTEEYNAIEMQKTIDKRARNFAHRQDIERQMQAKCGQTFPEMSEHEVSMNRPLLQLVERTLQERDDMEQYGAVDGQGCD